MTYEDRWRRKIPASIAAAVRLAQGGESIDFTYGLLATAVLWPARAAVQDFEPEAMAALHAATKNKDEADGPGGKPIIQAMQTWEGDRLAAGRALAEQAAGDVVLRGALDNLLAHFDATAVLQEQLSGQFGDASGAVIEQIRAAIVNVGGVLTIDTLVLSTPPVEIPAPAAPDKPPSAPNFIGRDQELAYFEDMLRAHHIAVICGMAGVGKTALAATLAARRPKPEGIFWHTFHAGESIESLIWELANFLAWQGQDDLWRLLQHARHAGSAPPPARTLFKYVIQMLRGRDYLLCLDDLQYVEDDPLLSPLVERLRGLIYDGELHVIITSRQSPQVIQRLQFEPLSGLGLEDTRRLLMQRGAALDEDALIALHTLTEGNATFLTLAANALAGGVKPARLLARLADTGDVTQYLMEQVDNQLSAGEQAIMTALAILQGYPGSRDAIAAICEDIGVWRPLQQLAQRHLLIVQERAQEPIYSLHSLVQAFYYRIPARRERDDMHRRAAAYFSQEGDEPLRAASHFLNAREPLEAAQILVADFWRHVNHGQLRELAALLGQLKPAHLASEDWARVQLTLGRAQTLLGERDAARAALDEASATLDQGDVSDQALSKGVTQRLRLELCLAQAELLGQTAPDEALRWLRLGLASGAQESQDLNAALLVKQGEIDMAQGNLESAIETLEAGLAHMPPAAAFLQCEALRNLSGVYFWQGKLERARKAARQGLATSRRLHDHYRTIDLLSNLGLCNFTAGHWEEAISGWQEALQLARDLGSQQQELFVGGNLGVAYVYTGNHMEARRLQDACFALARQLEDRFSLQVTYFYRAELSLRLGELAEARSALGESQALAQALEAKASIVEVEGLWAEILLEEGNPARARERAETALAQSRELELSLEEGRLLRTFARALAALGETEQATRHFAASYELLSDIDPYEAARTRAYWGQTLQATDAQRAKDYLDEAQATFAKLGAERDLAWLLTLQETPPGRQM